MFSSLTIKTKLLLISLFAIVLVSSLIAFKSISSLKELSNNNVENFRSEAYLTKEKELQNYVSLALKTVQTYYNRTSIKQVKIEVQEDLKAQAGFLFSILNYEYKKLKGTMPEEQVALILKEIVEGTRYGENGYFWINDKNAVIVMHPIKPQLNGKDLQNFKDKNGKKIFKEFAEATKSTGEGFVDYVWPKPGFEKPQPKVSFVKLFKPFNWVIGTGAYVNDVSAEIKKSALKSISEMRYGKSGYFWIQDLSSKMIMHPIKPALNGKELFDLKDKAGKKFFAEMTEVAKNNSQGGLVKYIWEKPGENTPKQKFSFVQQFKSWGWIIGTGAYVDDIEEYVVLMEEGSHEEINEVIKDTLISTLIIIVLIYLIYSFFINRTIIRPLKDLIVAIKDVSEGSSQNNLIAKKSEDEIGEVVDTFNSYVKKLQDGYDEDAKVIEEVEDVIQKVNNGFYVYKVTLKSSNPLVQKLRESINLMIERTNEKLEDINNILIEYGNSNFDYKNNSLGNSASNGIVGSILTSSKELGGTVSEFLSMITTSGDKLNKDTDILSSSSKSLSQSANEQAASLEETAAAVEEITSIIKSSNEKVSRMSILANELNESAKDGESLATKTTASMEDINKQVNSINDAITVIDQIAFQTNILSLNAAVEAATAGEAGKGFAVVAQEVRNLASRSAQAAKEIKAIVENATLKANEGKVIADNMIGGYSDLNNKINETIELISDVTTASKEQETGIIQINDAINTLDQSTQQNASSATQISVLSNEVLDLSADLLRIADRAKFNTSKKSEICDIDLVFQISKLKNDHIIFKNDNFAKVGSLKTWSVTSSKDCDFAKWIEEQELNNKTFTKNSNWSDMKKYHDDVHANVQNYVDENANNAQNIKLENISKKLEDTTAELFSLMDKVKVEHCKSYLAEAKTIEQIDNKEETKTYSKVHIDNKKIESKINKVSSSAKIISSNNNTDDEWESF